MLLLAQRLLLATAQVYPGCGVDLNNPWNLAISFVTASNALGTCDLATTNETLNCYAILLITCRNAKIIFS